MYINVVGALSTQYRESDRKSIHDENIKQIVHNAFLE